MSRAQVRSRRGAAGASEPITQPSTGVSLNSTGRAASTSSSALARSARLACGFSPPSRY
jgi:hypothetical protein